MNRFVGMLLVFAAVIAVIVFACAGFYLAAGWLGVGFNAISNAIFGTTGWSRAAVYFGASVANILTLLLVVMMISGSLLTVAERKWSAMIQNRIGANRIKVFGSPLGGIPFLAADALKMLTKERVEPRGRNQFLYFLAPALAFAPVFALFAVIPVGMGISLSEITGQPASAALDPISLQAAHPDVGLLYVFAFASLQVYGTALAGWASNNKLALLGGVRASSQMISYEVSLGLSLVGCMIAYRTLRLDDMVVAQGQAVLGPIPAVGILIQPIGFLVFFASAFAETKRAPFDLPEGESEIVGYFVEYSGMKFGLMFLAEFIEIVVLSGIVTAVFLGGWHPYLFEGWLQSNLSQFWFASVGAAAFIVKMVLMMWLQITIRWLLPRFRFDQIQKLCWKILLPAALANVFVAGAALLIDPSMQLLAAIGIVTLVIVAVITAAVGRAPAPEAGHAAAHAAAGH
ncbi:complex I subunit 1/NuoH family protein [Anaeromyxobacter oryzae]|uniref:NADH-quinone oxidoreductase subunit H n=1 Tax=Anaeromyxobacter oryzae TaxID=2918170 RepID=A0ABM7WQV0_9BACT|nr:complex I subunit 1 family protein [Anaeromyxobacter oryzae]BDG01847.1 NADH-quinone oxidoreductase subunit H 2 [Anaeromyxobacter oryzae]